MQFTPAPNAHRQGAVVVFIGAMHTGIRLFDPGTVEYMSRFNSIRDATFSRKQSSSSTWIRMNERRLKEPLWPTVKAKRQRTIQRTGLTYTDTHRTRTSSPYLLPENKQTHRRAGSCIWSSKQFTMLLSSSPSSPSVSPSYSTSCSTTRPYRPCSHPSPRRLTPPWSSPPSLLQVPAPPPVVEHRCRMRRGNICWNKAVIVSLFGIS